MSETSEGTKPPKVKRVYILDGDERHACPIPGSLEKFGWCEIDRDVSRPLLTIEDLQLRYLHNL